MFCPQCGYQNNDNVSFCQQCGAALKQTQQPQQPQQPQQQSYQQPQQQSYQQPAQQSYQQPQQPTQQSYQQQGYYQQPVQRPKPVLSSHPVLNVLKNLVASPLFMVAIIAFSVSALFQLIGAFTTSLPFSQYLDILYEIDRDLAYHVADMYSSLNAGLVIVGLVGAAPAILMAVGMWMIYTSGIDRTNGGMKVGGLTIIKVITIIEFIFTCIAFGIIEIFMLVGMIGVSSSGGYGAGPAVGGLFFLFLVIGGIAALAIIYYVKLLKTIGTINNSILTGTPSANISTFVAVICIIGGIFSGIGALISLFTGMFLTFLSGAAGATASICFGLYLFSYKNQMLALMGGANRPQPQPTYNQPQY